MNRLSLALLCLILSGCQSAKSWYHPLDVSLKDNQPCFSVPAGSVGKNDRLQNRGIIVSRQEHQQWRIVWTSPEISPLLYLQPGQCVTYPQMKWAAGEYSVLLGVSLNNDAERRKYVKTFGLSADEQGKIQLLARNLGE
ncbi:putative T6SS immunity periplasmic lipoprotein [Serratia ficaria]|uniref:putative T6SS immunity periplasmic lipoprotein n=1 Tax=Serratia ficaria TaxID=61651 RepID=UPI002177AFBC|nr:putative T6SS immunity periplasmic lipoprotein [Serratia ficaria]CAI0956534.1 Uncharacterised protein [Serratia ficaria]CAI1820135.1 Uncharacterised protein [Serratia ficaria]